jgi:ferredoxin
MKVIVDMTLCDGNGVCMGVAPEVFEIDDDLNLILLDATPPEELRGKVEQAVISCPRLAIAIEG